MPLYFVDLEYDQTETRDDAGSDVPDPEAARDEAVRMLADVLKSEGAQNGERKLVATVRNSEGQNFYQLVLALTCRQRGQEAEAT